jgi:hypothetical protein
MNFTPIRGFGTSGRSPLIGALTWSVTVRRGSDFAVRSSRRSGRQDLGLVLDLGVYGFEGRGVGTPMVGAEHQFSATG